MRDEQFAHYPQVVGEPHIRFYAGAPLISPENHVLGALCVMDRVPRALERHEREALLILARQVMMRLEFRRQQDRLRTVTDNAPVGLMICDRERACTFANPAYAKMLGKRVAEVTGVSLAKTMGSFYEGAVRLCLDQAFGGERVAFEATNRLEDGEHFFEMIFEPRTIRGEIVQVMGVVHDITERKRAEVALRSRDKAYHTADRRLAAIVESSDDAIIGKDLRGMITNWNKGAELVFGYTAAEVLGKSIMLLIPNDRKNEEDFIIGRIRKGESVAHFDSQRRTKNGRLIDVSITASPIKDETGRVIGASKIARDITQRKQIEAIARESRERLDAALSSMTDAVCISDASGHFIEFNEAFAAFHRFPDKVSCARKLSDYPSTIELLSPKGELVPLDMWAIPRALRGEAITNAEYTLRRKDTGETWVASYSFAPIRSAEGKLVGSVVVARDVTAQKKLEEQLLRSQRMESLGTLAGGIAHDLNNVLGPIMLSLSLLEETATEDTQDLLAILTSSARRGSDMVKQILSFARGVSGGRLLVQLAHLIAEIEKIANETFLKHVAIRTKVPSDTWTVVGDPTQLHQVLLNLCVNARDAMPSGGILTISAQNLHVDSHYAALDFGGTPGPYVLIEVEDSGSGMPPEVLEKIFDPFFTTKAVGEGTGLGLSTSLSIVKSHGGFIRVYSEPGLGTKFKIYLPADTEISSDALNEPAIEAPRGSGELVLVIDDEASVRQITKQTLEAFGYRVLLAGDGSEAVAIFVKQRAEIDVVLTDMMMPIMDGPAAIKALHEMKSDLPIIAASGLSTSDHIARASTLGVRHFLPKPYTADNLLRTLKETLTVG
jgi:PAS domain S-box-containing protein